ncbi:hypothetical protein KC19_N022500 [Ceratodon purpureus]|nr:hypothetical protein KC19_N022500 [Ceratodon purpureus]KAG0504537.1 hypothetical protein KC19_N022500 [Ceratodon purpureus]
MEVSMELHRENREKLCRRMRGEAGVDGAGWEWGGVVAGRGGAQPLRHGPHAAVPAGELLRLLVRGEGAWVLWPWMCRPGCRLCFAPAGSRVCCVAGGIQPPKYFKELYGVDEVYYVDEMADVFGVKERSSSDWKLYVLYGKNTDSGSFSKPAEFQGIEKWSVDKDVLHSVLSECRVHKSDLEIELMRYVCKVSSAAHIQVMQECKPGMTEYQLEAIFLHHVYRYGGCRHCSYTCICATGANSSVLHYGHASAPNDRLLQDGDMALLDMGAEYHFYGSDITCSFPVNGTFTNNQRIVYGAVLKAWKAVIAAIRPGVSWGGSSQNWLRLAFLRH